MIAITATSISNEAASIEIKLHFKQSLQPPHLSCLERHGADLLRGTCTSPAETQMKPRFKHQGHPWKKTIRSSQFLKFFKRIHPTFYPKLHPTSDFPCSGCLDFAFIGDDINGAILHCNGHLFVAVHVEAANDPTKFRHGEPVGSARKWRKTLQRWK